MNLPDRHLLLGMTLGATCATALAATGPGMIVEAFAEEVAGPAFDPARLVKFEDSTYRVEHEDWVATDPLSTETIKKVEAGRVSYVTITKTATGTYSSEAMMSPHVQYPGISVERVAQANPFRFWTDGGWQNFHPAAARSFLYYGGATLQPFK